MLNLNVDKTDEAINSIEKSEGSDPSAKGSATALAALNDNNQNTWKVLVFDSLGRDIISSVLRVNDLFKVSHFSGF